MKEQVDYHIGKIGEPWGDEEKKQWASEQSAKRDYHSYLEPQIFALNQKFKLETYGKLDYQKLYNLYVLRTNSWVPGRPTVLITGGVHGYETSGVMGALAFAFEKAKEYESLFNFVIVPCVSPWGFEMIHRWNPDALDPNRSFFVGSGVPESEQLMALVNSEVDGFIAHFDLHETTDDDRKEFRPALAAREGLTEFENMIPDGFYVVGDQENPQFDFQAAVIAEVGRVTAITESDEEGKIIGALATQKGVINYPLSKLSLCGSITTALYTTTTEVYPDSKSVTKEECVEAQVAAITGGLDYITRMVARGLSLEHKPS